MTFLPVHLCARMSTRTALETKIQGSELREKVYHTCGVSTRCTIACLTKFPKIIKHFGNFHISLLPVLRIFAWWFSIFCRYCKCGPSKLQPPQELKGETLVPLIFKNLRCFPWVWKEKESHCPSPPLAKLKEDQLAGKQKLFLQFMPQAGSIRFFRLCQSLSNLKLENQSNHNSKEIYTGYTVRIVRSVHIACKITYRTAQYIIVINIYFQYKYRECSRNI